jgi:Tfp pilus assembly protein PilX
MTRLRQTPWRGRDQRGLVLVIALSVMAMLLVGAVVLLRMASIDRDVPSNAVWTEGSFFAADAAINVALDTIAPEVQSCASARTALGGGYTYQVLNTPPNTSCFTGTQREAGYSVGSGTGYNPGGYVFYTFAFTGLGTGPRSAQRTIDARAAYGPVAQ